jgi:hypothetical protein
MALAKLPHGISSIRGSLPGIVYRSVGSSVVVSSRPTHISQDSARQLHYQSAFRAGVSLWRSLSEEDRAAWSSSARYFNRWLVNRADRRFTPRQLFLSRYLDFEPLSYPMAALLPQVLPVEEITDLSLVATPVSIVLSITKLIGIPVYIGIPSVARSYRIGPIWRPCWRRIPKISLFGVGVIAVDITTSTTDALGVPSPGETLAVSLHATTLSSYPSPTYIAETIVISA